VAGSIGKPKSTTPLHLVAARLAKGAPILGLSSKIAKLTDFVSLSCGNRCEIDSRKVETESTNSRFLQEQRQLLPLRESSPVGWLRLSEATSLMDHDVQKARVALERGISKSWLIRTGGILNQLAIRMYPCVSKSCHRRVGGLRVELG
jgi:hypothetical protein